MIELCTEDLTSVRLILPGYDTQHGNKNSCLFRGFPDECEQYVLDKPLCDQHWNHPHAESAIVHSFGFFIFLVGLKNGLFQHVKNLIVIDGWFPRDGKFQDHAYSIHLPTDIKCTFFFPTVGDRKDYPLEAIVRQFMATKDNHEIVIIRGEGYGHNLIYNEFTSEKMVGFVQKLEGIAKMYRKSFGMEWRETKLSFADGV